MGRMSSATIAFVAWLLLLPACTTGQGPAVERTREIGSFTRIEVDAGIHIKVKIGAASPLVVRAEENIQGIVETSARDGTLRVTARDNFTVANPVVVEVTVPSLTAVSLAGGAAIEVNGLATDAFDVSLSGGARATISGTAREVTLTASGGSDASLASLDAETVSVDVHNGSTAAVRATGSVQGSAFGGSHLTVSGGGSLDVEVSGGADVKRA